MNTLRQIRHVIYNLKRHYGVPAKIIYNATATYSYITGAAEIAEDFITVARVIKLPEQAYRDFAYDLTYVAANKNFAYGALYDKDIISIILDAKDVPQYIPKLDDRIIIEGKRYNYRKIKATANALAYIIQVEGVESQPIENPVVVTAAQDMEATNEPQLG